MPKLPIAVVLRGLSALGSAAGALLQSETVAAAPPAVERPPPERFGEAGQLVLPNLLGYGYPTGLGHTLAVWHTEDELRDGTEVRRSIIGVVPSADYFVASRWSVGASVQVLHWAEDYDSTDPELGLVASRWTQLGVMPRLGYAVPLGSEVTLWPRLGVGGALGFDEESLDHEALQLTAELPVLFHLGRYVFASGGFGATATLGRGEPESAIRRHGAIAVSGTTALGVVFGR